MPRRPVAPTNSTIVRFESWSRRAVDLLGRLLPGPMAAVAERLFFTAPRPRRSRAEAFLRAGRRCNVRVGGRRVAAWHFGRGPAVLLVHGWAGRAAQMSAFVPPLLGRGLSAVVFDAPGHGESGRAMSSAVQFASAMRALASQEGPFHAVIAHSLGASATALALRQGLAARRLAFLGPAASPPAWARVFAEKLGLPDGVLARLQARSEKRLGLPWEELDVPRLASGLEQPLLVVHDCHDPEVSVEDGRAIAAAWQGARYVETTGLGHTRILRDATVVEDVTAFVSADAPSACACGSGASAADCEGCGIERDLFDRDARWASLGGATLAAWPNSYALPSTSRP